MKNAAGVKKGKVTMKDIAKRLDISQNTVSLALRNIPTIKKETREEILRMADELGYVYNESGAQTGFAPAGGKVQTQQNICIFTDSSYFSTFYFYTELKTFLESRLNSLGYGLIVESMFNPRMTREQLGTFCQINSIKGVIILGDMAFEQIHLVFDLDIPVVTSGFYFCDRFTDCVMEDNLSAIHNAVYRLYERGYRKIGFLGNVSLGVGQRERYMGFQAALDALGLERRPEWVLTDCAADTETLFHDQKRYLQAHPALPEVFLCGCDQIAICVMEAAQDLGLRIPDDIGLVGFDNIDLTLNVQPRLTTLDPGNAAQADLIVSTLTDRIGGGKAPLRRQIVEVTWIEGGSIRPAQEK
ncbi:LacI family transcriptional regulator [Butyricicoccus faecihominis]|nr:LacI family transcriptional regulator [Butyricicoccus faecihominis]